MKNFKELKELQLITRKNKEKVAASFLSTLIGEVELEVKRSNANEDEVLLKTATKFKKNLEQTFKIIGSSPEWVIENTQVELFLPKELSMEKISSFITTYVAEFGKDMKVIMPKLKQIEGMNMRIASQILKEL